MTSPDDLDPEASSDPREISAAYFAIFTGPDSTDAEREQARNDLIALHLPLVEHLARRFSGRGEPYEDLVQVGTIGLIKAVDRFEPEREVAFSTYATPTVLGEIKRHFRDKGWAIRVPRRLQEIHLAISSTTGELTQELGRSPTVQELADRLGVSRDEIVEGLESGRAYSTLSIDAPASGTGDRGEGMPSIAETVGDLDADMAHVEDRETIRPLLATLDERSRRIVGLRFFHGMTQSQIAAEVGISQMHVSRLLAKALTQLREHIDAPEGQTASAQD